MDSSALFIVIKFPRRSENNGGYSVESLLATSHGRGHSLVIHAQDDTVIMRFGLEKPVFRILVNTLGTLGATGLTTGVMPSMTLGPGGYGGAITGDNITVHHMYNVKRLAYELTPPPAAALQPGATDDPSQLKRPAGSLGAPMAGLDPDRLDDLVRRVLAELKR